MGSAPSKNNPFTKAGKFIDNRKHAKISEDVPWTSLHNEEVVGAIAKAWLQLPSEIRTKGWSVWMTHENNNNHESSIENEVI